MTNISQGPAESMFIQDLIHEISAVISKIITGSDFFLKDDSRKKWEVIKKIE